jgi:hypothetical protein
MAYGILEKFLNCGVDFKRNPPYLDIYFCSIQFAVRVDIDSKIATCKSCSHSQYMAKLSMPDIYL